MCILDKVFLLEVFTCTRDSQLPSINFQLRYGFFDESEVNLDARQIFLKLIHIAVLFNVRLLTKHFRDVHGDFRRVFE